MRLSLLTTLVWLILMVADAQTTFSGRVVADESKKGWAGPVWWPKTADISLWPLPGRKKTEPLS